MIRSGCFRYREEAKHCGSFQQRHPRSAFRLHLAWVARPHVLRRELGVVACVRGQDDTTVLGEEDLTGGA
jgi:hypothetical protein